MNVFAANDLEAADLLALARLDDDGAPPAVTTATGQGAALRGQPGSGPAPVIAAVADWGQACRAEGAGGRR
jgi:hypothetical protein